MAKATKPTQKSKAVKEDVGDYNSGEQFIPTQDKQAALDAIFRNADIKHGLTLFAKHEIGFLDLWEKGGRYYFHCLI